MRMQNMKRGETTEQITLFNWARNHEHALPGLALMYHVPNEGKRSNGDILKAAGMKKGVPDVVLPVASNNFHGLYLEMKYDRNKPTKEQEAFMAALRQQGYKTAVCYGFKEAKEEILSYLQEPGKMPLEKCLAAPRIDGRCDGVPLPGRLFGREECRKCDKYNISRAERLLFDSLERVEDDFKAPIINAIISLSTGKLFGNCSLEDMLEVINRNLAFLVKQEWIRVEESAKALTVAMDAYEAGKKVKGDTDL